MKVGVIGLGIMGGAMTGNLVRCGFKVVGYDPSASAVARAKAAGIDTASSAEGVVKHADLVLTSLASLAAVRETASVILEHAPSPRIVIETSTLPLSEKLAFGDALAAGGHLALDCPVLGTAPHAERAELVIYASGDKAAQSSAQAVFDAIGKKTFDLGAYGNGTRMKLVNNHMISIYNAAAGETMVFGMQAGLHPQMIIDVINAGVTAKVFEFLAPMVAADRYDPPTMKISVWHKDIAAISALAHDVGAPLPMFDAARPLYAAALAAGQGDLDKASTARVIERMAGITRSPKTSS